MKIAPVALLLLPLTAALEGLNPVVDGKVCQKKMHTKTKWRPDVIKRVFCAIKDPAGEANMRAYGVDKNNKKLFECTVILKYGKLVTCCGVDEGIPKCADPVNYKGWKHLGEDIIGLWLNWDSDSTYVGVSNDFSVVKTHLTSSSGDQIVNATAQGMSGTKYCFPWGCEAGPDGKSICS